MQEKAGEQGAAYIPMPKGRGFTPHFDNVTRDIIANQTDKSVALIRKICNAVTVET